MDQSHKNQHSTKVLDTVTTEDDDIDPELITECTHCCYTAYFEPTRQTCANQTDQFVAPSSSGNKYLMVLCNYDDNQILAQPFKNRTASCIVNAYKVPHEQLCQSGHKPALQRLDNECSKELKPFMKDNDVDFQLVPPHVHCRNAAERAIRTFKTTLLPDSALLIRSSPYTFGMR